MRAERNVHVNERNGNLHIDLSGRFSEETAAQLTDAMQRAYRGAGNIFIHTSKVTEVGAESHSAFRMLIGCSGLPRENIYLMGEKGMALGDGTAKVIVPRKKKHRCCGKCQNCSCSGKS